MADFQIKDKPDLTAGNFDDNDKYMIQGPGNGYFSVLWSTIKTVLGGIFQTLIASPTTGDIVTVDGSGQGISSGVQIDDLRLPIGFSYTQFPGDASPVTLNLYGTWSNVSSELPGDFLRFEGGEASAFESGQQADQMQGVKHYIQAGAAGYGLANQPAGAGGLGSVINRAAVGDGVTNLWTTTQPHSDGVNGTPRIGTTTYPKNRTARKWRRTA